MPLGKALEIAEDAGYEAELYCIPGRFAYVQHHEAFSAWSETRAIVYRRVGAENSDLGPRTS